MKLILSIFILSLIVGCGVTIKVEKPDGTKYSYERGPLTSQALEGVHFRTPEGAEFTIAKQESTDTQAALKTLNKALDRIPYVP